MEAVFLTMLYLTGTIFLWAICTVLVLAIFGMLADIAVTLKGRRK